MCVLTTSESARMTVILHDSMVYVAVYNHIAGRTDTLLTDIRNDYIRKSKYS